MLSDLEKLKFNLQERQFPYFQDDELLLLLETSDNDINKATYKGLMMKAQNDSVDVGSIKTASNQSYWLKLAQEFKPKRIYNTSMQRADGQ